MAADTYTVPTPCGTPLPFLPHMPDSFRTHLRQSQPLAGFFFHFNRSIIKPHASCLSISTLDGLPHPFRRENRWTRSGRWRVVTSPRGTPLSFRLLTILVGSIWFALLQAQAGPHTLLDVDRDDEMQVQFFVASPRGTPLPFRQSQFHFFLPVEGQSQAQAGCLFLLDSTKGVNITPYCYSHKPRRDPSSI